MAYRQQQISNQEEEEKVKETDLLYRQINFITKTCSKLYFNKILKKLAEKNSENVNIICEYIIAAEETQLNIKNSTKESRIKVLVWLSGYMFRVDINVMPGRSIHVPSDPMNYVTYTEIII